MRVYLNSGTDAAPVLTGFSNVLVNGRDFTVGTGGYGYASPNVVDWNNDGNKDLVVGGGFDGYVFLLLNTGTDADPVFDAAVRIQNAGVDLSVGEWSSAAVSDWDKDGKKDLLVVGYDDPGSAPSGSDALHFYRNVGTDAAPVFDGYQVAEAGGEPLSGDKVGRSLGDIDVVDWDSDGFPDLLMTSGDYYTLGGYNVAYYHHQNPNAPFVTVSALDATALENSANTALLRFARSFATNTALTVDYRVGGTADVADYSPALTGSATIAAGSDYVDVVITGIDDGEPEAPETLTVETAYSVGYNRGLGLSASITILDDDNAPPSCTLTAPTNGLAYEAGDMVTLSADASDDYGLVAVEFYVDGLLVGTATNVPYQIVWEGEVGSHTIYAKSTDSCTLETTSTVVSVSGTAIPDGSGAGFSVDRYDGISGTEVSDLTSAPAYPDAPDYSAEFISGQDFEYEPNLDGYGSRLQALFVAPKTGNYTFYLGGDERAELWLSTDDQPSNVVRKTYLYSTTLRDSWTRRTAAVPLTAGNRYYIMVLHKEDAGDDFVQVGVELPGKQFERPIPAHRLVQYLEVKADKETVYVPEGSTSTVRVALDREPANTVTVKVSLVSGDTDLSAAPASLVFTPSNWSSNQTVTLSAGADADAVDGTAVSAFSVVGSGRSTLTAVEVDAELDHTPVAVNSPGATSISTTSAELGGTLTNGVFANAWICWGAADGGAVATGDWDNVISMGELLEGVPFTTMATGLETNRTYWYRCYVSNAYGTGWSAVATTFGGTAVIGPGREMTAHVGVNIVGSAGAGGTLDSSDVAGYVPQTNWNNMCIAAKDDTLTSVYDSAGNLVDGMTVDTSIGAWDDVSVSSASNELGPHANLFEGFIEDNDGSLFTPRIRVTGIPWAEYDVYVYLNSENDGNGAVRVNGGGTEYYATMGSFPAFSGYTVCDDTTSPAGTQFNTVIFSNVVGQTLDVEMARFGNRIGLSGIQIVGRSPVIGNSPATGITSSEAVLNGTLFALGTDYDVYVGYGTSDGGTNAEAWAVCEYVGSWTHTSTNVGHAVSGLTAGTTYHYAFMVSNSSGAAWAAPSWCFVTAGSRPVTTSYSVPTDWLDSTIGTTNDYEAAVSADPDGDGFTTWQEYWCGTDPTDPDSCFEIESIEYVGNQVVIKWRHAAVDAGVPPIVIRGCTNLAEGAWTDVGNCAPVNGTNTWSATAPVGRFYRLSVTVP